MRGVGKLGTESKAERASAGYYCPVTCRNLACQLAPMLHLTSAADTTANTGEKSLPLHIMRWIPSQSRFGSSCD